MDGEYFLEYCCFNRNFSIKWVWHLSISFSFGFFEGGWSYIFSCICLHWDGNSLLTASALIPNFSFHPSSSPMNQWWTIKSIFGTNFSLAKFMDQMIVLYKQKYFQTIFVYTQNIGERPKILPGKILMVEILLSKILLPKILVVEILLPKTLFSKILLSKILFPKILVGEILLPKILFPKILVADPKYRRAKYWWSEYCCPKYWWAKYFYSKYWWLTQNIGGRLKILLGKILVGGANAVHFWPGMASPDQSKSPPIYSTSRKSWKRARKSFVFVERKTDIRINVFVKEGCKSGFMEWKGK